MSSYFNDFPLKFSSKLRQQTFSKFELDKIAKINQILGSTTQFFELLSISGSIELINAKAKDLAKYECNPANAIYEKERLYRDINIEKVSEGFIVMLKMLFQNLKANSQEQSKECDLLSRINDLTAMLKTKSTISSFHSESKMKDMETVLDSLWITAKKLEQKSDNIKNDDMVTIIEDEDDIKETNLAEFLRKRSLSTEIILTTIRKISNDNICSNQERMISNGKDGQIFAPIYSEDIENQRSLIPQHERQSKSVSEVTFDLKIRLDSLLQLKKPLEISYSGRNDLQKYTKANYIGVIGGSKSGKSWLINWLSNKHETLKIQQATSELGFKHIPPTSSDIVPILIEVPAPKGAIRYEDYSRFYPFKPLDEKIKQDCGVTESFIYDYVVDIATTLIIMVDKAGHWDQLLVEKLAKLENKTVIVVHNFKDVAQTQELIDHTLYNVKKPFNAKFEKIKATNNSEIEYYLQEISGKKVVHFIVAKEGTAAAYNNLSLSKYFNTLTSTYSSWTTLNKNGPIDTFIDHINNKGLRYLIPKNVSPYSFQIKATYENSLNGLEGKITLKSEESDWSLNPENENFLNLMDPTNRQNDIYYVPKCSIITCSEGIKFLVDIPMLKDKTLQVQVDCLPNCYGMTLTGERENTIKQPFGSILKLGQIQNQVKLVEYFQCIEQLDNYADKICYKDGVCSFIIPYSADEDDISHLI